VTDFICISTICRPFQTTLARHAVTLTNAKQQPVKEMKMNGKIHI